jgi:hypothetical protein
MPDPKPSLAAPNLLRSNAPPDPLERVARPSGPGNVYDDLAQKIASQAGHGATRGDEPSEPKPASPMPLPFKTTRR